MNAPTVEERGKVRRSSQARRARNRARAAALLTEAGITYESKSNGSHLIVAKAFDFWPGTGVWHERGRGKQQLQRGLLDLIQRVKEKRP